MVILNPKEHHWMKSSNTERLFKAFPEGTLRFVGGCVRDALLGLEVNDVDLATKLLPEGIINCLIKSNIKFVPTGIKHGTITAILDADIYQITSLRIDTKTNGRHAEVTFNSSWKTDANRRDFTINSLYADFTGKVYDPIGQGLDDLKTSKICFVGRPENRIKEDYLRIIRYFRFVSDYGKINNVDQDTLEVIKANFEGLSKLSPERLWLELKKLFASSSIFHALYLMKETGVLHFLLPEVKEITGLKKLEKLEMNGFISIDPILRLMVIICRDTKKIDILCKRFNMSSKETKRLRLWAASKCEVKLNSDDIDIIKFIYIEGKEVFSDRCVSEIVNYNEPSNLNELKALLVASKKMIKPIFPIKGADLKYIGYEPGPQMGIIIDALELIWINSGFNTSKENLLLAAEHLD